MLGIDISTFQKEVDYNKLKEQGIEFVIIRCGYGKMSHQKDEMFEKHYEGCKKAGLKIGTYLYSYCSNVEDADKEAENCINFIKDKQFDLPIFYDLEEERTSRLGKESVTIIAERFCNKLRLAGYTSGVYANLYWFNNNINVNYLISKDIKIWLAQWAEKPIANFKVDYWQYTNNGFIDGISGRVDMNKCLIENNEIKPQLKSNNEIAEEVINGLWENQPERQQRLEREGYNYQKIQEIVNRKLIKNETVYIVKKGDNLTKIAKLYGTTIKKLKEVNNIENANKIYVGQRLIIK